MRSPKPNVRNGDWLDTLWTSDGIGARVARAALMPAELAFGIITTARSSLYSSGIFLVHAPAIPALGIGNLTVGGTGKTPIAAHFAVLLKRAGAKPAIILRGYGEDEPLVHRTLNPDVPVLVSPDRIAGAADAKRAGCDVVVLDDACQHRRAGRAADVVLVSADGWREHRHLLPAGPWRERLTAARRASIVIVTRKAVSLERADFVSDVVRQAVGVPCAVVHLNASELSEAHGSLTATIDALRGESVLAISAIGDPAAFEAQLMAQGAAVTPARFRDHHRFTASDAESLAKRANRYDRAACTLKDAVKLGPLWPGPSPLWYVSQRVVVERGDDAVDGVLETTLRARSASTQPGRPGLPGPRD